MMKWWRPYADKIDALTQRERTVVFIAVVISVAFIANLLMIEPLVVQKTALANRMTQQRAELQRLRTDILEMQRKLAVPNAANLSRRDGIRQQIGDIDASLKDMQHSLVPAQSMKSVLQEVLARNPRLQLISMRTLPVAPLVERRDKPEDSATVAKLRDKVAVTETGVFKHGVQITLAGNYGDMYDYLARLEKMPWRMFWSRASLSAGNYPHLTMTVTIYTLSLDKAWLVV